MLRFGGFGWHTSPSARDERSRIMRGCGFRKPAAATVALLALAACAVGPDFQPPPAPPQSGYTPEAKLASTASADVAAGASQKFDPGRDIPAEWWKVFHSPALNALIAEALSSNPNLKRHGPRCGRRRKICTPKPASCYRPPMPMVLANDSNSRRLNSAEPGRRQISISTRPA